MDIDLRALPYRVRLIAELAGIENTYRFLSEHGAKSIRIKKAYTPGCTLEKRFGVEVAKALFELWPNQCIDIPKVDKMTLQIRDIKIMQELKEGVGVAEVRARYNLTRQRIYQLKNEAEQPDMNMGFDF